MSKYSIMGSTPGEGGIVEADSHKQAFAIFCVDEGAGYTYSEIMKAISEGDHAWEKIAKPFEDNPNFYVYGSYEIKLFSGE